MKKYMLCLVSPALLLLTGCGSSEDSDRAGARLATDDDRQKETARVDTVRKKANIPFQTKKFEERKGDNELDMEYPVSGNPELLDSVRMWMSGQLLDTYQGNLDDPEAFFRHYASQMGVDPELYGDGVYTRDDFRVGYLNDNIVTYDYTSYIYEGGAHEYGGTYGITFLQSDGSIFTRDCITSYKPLHPMIIAGLKRYFKVHTDQELKDKLIISGSLNRLAPPGRDPWINGEGVVFSYTPYEIADFDAGSPRFTIPYSEIEPYLTEQGKRFFEEGSPSADEEPPLKEQLDEELQLIREETNY